MALQHTQIRVVTRRKASVHAQQTQNCQTHLGAQGHAQGKTDGLESCPGTQRVRIHTHSVRDGSRTPANCKGYERDSGADKCRVDKSGKLNRYGGDSAAEDLSVFRSYAIYTIQ